MNYDAKKQISFHKNTTSFGLRYNFGKTKFFVTLKILASITKIFASLHDLAKRECIRFRINTMLEALILQGCIVSELVARAMINQRIGRVGTVFANYANEI